MDRILQRRFVREKKITHQFFSGLLVLLEPFVREWLRSRGIQSQPRLIIRQRDQIVHLRLMTKHEMRNDVARSSEISGRVDVLGEIGDVGAGGSIQLLGMVLALNDHITHVRLSAVRAGDIPSAPAFAQRALLAGDERLGSDGLSSRGRGENRSEQDAGDAARSGRDVALRAIQLGALEDGMVALVLVQYIEDGALHRIERNELEHFSVVHLADVNVVIEVERARSLRRDLFVLEAGLGKHQRLRVDRDLQPIKHRLQIAVRRFIV